MLLATDALSGAGDADLFAMVETAFPSLSGGQVRIDHGGGDHVVLVVDERYAFRFPRQGTRGLTLEIEVLKALRRRAVPTIPAYDYVDPDGRFAGYPYIMGEPLTPGRFAALTPAARADMIDEAAQFLSELHSIRPYSIAVEACWPASWTAAQYADRAVAERLSRLKTMMPASAASLDRFYATYRRDRTDRAVVIHGDLVGDHMLVDETGGRLSGIIDFGDVALGDLAQDFMGFWAYGEDAARHAVDAYRPAARDPGLLGRSFRHHVRYRLDRLFESCRDSSDDWRSAATDIAALLTREDAFPPNHDRR